jgi:hypothetical protein
LRLPHLSVLAGLERLEIQVYLVYPVDLEILDGLEIQVDQPRRLRQ